MSRGSQIVQGVVNKSGGPKMSPAAQTFMGVPNSYGASQIVIGVPNSYGGPKKLQFAAYGQFVGKV